VAGAFIFPLCLEDIVMTELRKRMIEDMELAGFAPATHDAYIRAVRQLAAHFCVSPDRLTESQLREYTLHLRNVRNLSNRYGFLRRVADAKSLLDEAASPQDWLGWVDAALDGAVFEEGLGLVMAWGHILAQQHP